ncbi:hypothetical protein [Candidatus Methylacidiphilum fumarolicum]|uniref:hypothetical protein n=1 Tax=Candidatus Methylacidiphilum fumarolicum TaxID=591154 RepID=UPI0011038910|nr:hypothetical protein [Candidatus Methylacidiphilum fumarolicum]TFE77629.1 hypothetical protein A7D33_03830 [Candidatus Methylacidiphilum fumarolicum]
MLVFSVMINPKIQQRLRWSEEAKRVAFWVLNSPQRIACVLGKRKPPASTFHLTKERQEAILFRLRKDLQKVIGRLLRVREARSILYDEEMYRTFEEKGGQYVALVSLERDKGIVILLVGNLKIRRMI